VNASGLAKHTEIVAMLKTECGLRHAAAHRVALLARDAAQPGPTSLEAAVDALYADMRAGLRSLHETLIAAVTAFGDDIQQSPKKAI
jgi:hypothetical protein